MNHLKKLAYLFFAITFMVSCEEESQPLQENLDATINLEGINSVSDAIEAGIDIQVYLNSLPKREVVAPKGVYSKSENSNLQFFYSAEDFPCAEGLPTESFDNANYEAGCFGGYLDENTDNGFFSPGDILPGISFESPNDFGCAFYLFSDDGDYDVDKALMDNRGYDLILNFTNEGVNLVSLGVLSWIWGFDVDIQVYGKNGYLGATTVNIGDFSKASYWGVVSLEPITKLVLNTHNYGWGYAGVDNISFGNCDDLDSDGCLNEDDAYPLSNKMEYVTIDGCNSGVTNALIDCGTFMMDEIDALIAEISAKAQEPRSRFRRAYNAQSEFNKKMYYLLGYWQSKGYITYTENREIMKCVGSADIDFEGNERPI
jgi:hypothetical protein